MILKPLLLPGLNIWMSCLNHPELVLKMAGERGGRHYEAQACEVHRGAVTIFCGIRGMRMLRLLVAIAEIQFKEDKVSLWLTFYWTLTENSSFGLIGNRCCIMRWVSEIHWKFKCINSNSQQKSLSRGLY